MEDDDKVREAIEAAYIAVQFDTYSEFFEYAKKNGWSDEEIETQRNAFPGASGKNSETMSDSGQDTVSSTQKTGLFEDYLAHLRDLGWADSTIKSIQEYVEETYGRLAYKNDVILSQERPGYGLVVGRIQSGKTAHMLGLSFRALDTTLAHQGKAYDTVIVLSGLLEDLRKQTHQRLINTKVRGVKFLPDGSDFSSSNESAKSELLESLEDELPTMLVIKKNHKVLEALIEYFEDDEIRTYAEDRKVLIIDDECDHASVDSTHSEVDNSVSNTNITATNQAVRKLIQVLSYTNPVLWYVGYTATPYSNLLMDPDPYDSAKNALGLSLFPRDVIHCLPKPDGHYDNDFFFGKEKHQPQIVKFQTPEEDGAAERKHLRDLIHMHVLTKLLRESHLEAKNKEKGKSTAENNRIWKHSTMIHTEVETQAHYRMANLVSTILEEEIAKHEVQLVASLENICKRHYSDLFEKAEKKIESITASKFIDLKRYFTEITVVKLNAESDDPEDEYEYPQELNYSDGKVCSHIVVGGQKLARGLTIEDLVLVWFDRTPATPNYDTLLQMARWCGYRGSFLELMKLFMSEESILHFSLIAKVERRLRRDLLLFDKTTNPLEEVQWIREYKGMRISARASPNAYENSNPSDASFIDPENHIAHLHSTGDSIEEKNIQFNIFEAFENMYIQHEDETVRSSVNPDFFIWEADYSELREFIVNYKNGYTYANSTRKYLRNLLIEFESNTEISSTWSVALFSPKSGNTYEDFVMSELGMKTPKEILLNHPINADKVDFEPGLTTREKPLLVIYLENSSQEIHGIPIYLDNGYPTVMMSFYLPEEGLSPSFVEFCRPSASTIQRGDEEE